MRKNLGTVKKMATIALVAVMMMSMVACGKKKASENENNGTEVSMDVSKQEDGSTQDEEKTGAVVEVEVDGVKQQAEVGAILETTNADGETVYYEVAEDGTLAQVEAPSVVEVNPDSGVSDVVSEPITEAPTEAPTNAPYVAPAEPVAPVAPVAPAPAPAPVPETQAPAAPSVILSADMASSVTGWSMYSTYDVSSSYEPGSVGYSYTKYELYEHKEGESYIHTKGYIVVGGDNDGKRQGYHYDSASGKMVFYNENPSDPLDSMTKYWVDVQNH